MIALPLMPWRLDELQATMAGFERSGVPLVALRDGRLGPAGFPDDPGLYWIVPAIARAFDLPADRAFEAFAVGLLAIAGALGVAGCLLWCRTLLTRAASIAVLLLVLAFAARVGDVYVVAPALAVAGVPLLLHLTSRRGGAALGVALFLIGAAAGLSHVVRNHAGTALLLFAAVLVAGAPATPRWHRAALLGALAAGLALSTLGARGAVSRRDAFLARTDAGYGPTVARHAFWHSVYIGMGFIDNPHVSAYQDEVAMARAAQLAPGAPLYSPPYEASLRAEVVRIATGHPFFVLRLLFAKLGVLLLYLLLAANVGLLFAVRAPLPRTILLAFGVALAFSALFGLLAVPTSTYLSGFVAFAALLGTTSAAHALDARARRRAPARAAEAA